MKLPQVIAAFFVLTVLLISCKAQAPVAPPSSKPISSNDLLFQSLSNPTISDLFPSDCEGIKGVNRPRLLKQTPLDNEVLGQLISRNGFPGRFVFTITISTEGRVTDVRMLEPKSQNWQASLPFFQHSFEQWQYEPSTMVGEPIACKWVVTINF